MSELWVTDEKTAQEKAVYKAEATRLRKEAKELSAHLDTGYMDLGRILYQVYDTKIDGDQKKLPIFRDWGFETFGSWVEAELSLNVRKAERLRGIFFKLEIELKTLDPEIKKRIVKLGWSKADQLQRALTARNAAEWIERAEKMSYPELQATVSLYLEAREKKRAEKAAEASPETATLPLADQPLEMNKVPETMTSTKEKKHLPEVLQAAVDAEAEDAAIPEADSFRWENFMLAQGQRDTVKQALERSKQITGSEKKGHQLEMIALDFLATNDFLKGGSDQLKRFFSKYEKLLGYRFIVVDPTSNDVFYGIDTLERLSKE